MHLSLKGAAAGVIIGAAVNLLLPVVNMDILDKQRSLNPPFFWKAEDRGKIEYRNGYLW